MSCPVCAAGRTRHKLEKQGVEILECGVCGLAWWVPEAGFDPSRVYAADYFQGSEVAQGYDDYAALEPSLRRTFARRFARLRPPCSGARLLDLGAAYGFAVSEARRAGWCAFGLEISRAAARAGMGSLGVPGVVASGLAAPFADASFDAVSLWDVLEHLPDPHAAMAEVSRILAPGGTLVLSTGDVGSWAARLSGARWHLYTLPEHLFFFSRESLRRLLAAHGLTVVRVRAEGAVYTAGYLVERLRKTLLGSRRPLAFPGSHWPVPMNLFDIVTVEAVRAGR